MYLSSKHKSFNKHCLLYSGALDIFTRRHMHHCINIYCTRWLLWRFPPLKKLQSTFIVLHCMLIKYIVCSTLTWDQLAFMVNFTRTNILFYVVDISRNVSHRQPQSPLPRYKKSLLTKTNSDLGDGEIYSDFLVLSICNVIFPWNCYCDIPKINCIYLEYSVLKKIE